MGLCCITSHGTLGAVLIKTSTSDRTLGAILRERALKGNKKDSSDFHRASTARPVNSLRRARASMMVTRPPQGIYTDTTAMRLASIVINIRCPSVQSGCPIPEPNETSWSAPSFPRRAPWYWALVDSSNTPELHVTCCPFLSTLFEERALNSFSCLSNLHFLSCF